MGKTGANEPQVTIGVEGEVPAGCTAAVPPVHVGRPYARPTAALAARVEVPTEDGACLAAFVYAPKGVIDEPGTPFGVDMAVPPVLMLHGNGEEHGIFGQVIDAVVATGRSVVALDSRAQGASSRGTAPLTYELLADDALAALARLGIWQAHVLGFSDGAIEGLLLARDHGEHVLSLTALGANLTPAGLSDEDQAWMAECAAANRAWAAGGRAGLTLADGTPVPSPANAAVTAELLQLMVDEPQIDAASLSTISCPVCVMAGEMDDILPEETERIAAAIPQARLVIVPDADHTLPKVAPEAVSRELLATIGENDARHAIATARTGASNVAVARLDASWSSELDALYERVVAEPNTSGWKLGAWPPTGMVTRLARAGSALGAFAAEDVIAGAPRTGARLLGAVSVDRNVDMGDGTLPGVGQGTGGPDWEPVDEGGAATYHLMAVSPEARGSGVSQALLVAAGGAARELGAKVVRINTSVLNVPANGLYQSWGFSRHQPVWYPYPGLELPGWTNVWERWL